MSDKSLKTVSKRFLIAVLFVIAFAYIEAAVVVYLRTIFYPAGFNFPILDFGTTPLWKQLLITEIGRETATLVIIFTGSWLIGHNLRQRVAYWLTIFAIWDIFYYIWLKALINWPASIMDWDILFLIPMAWAGPVLAPVIVSLTMLIFAVIILYRDYRGKTLRMTPPIYLGFILAGLIIIISFCIAGLHMTKPGYQLYFYWPLFITGEILAILLFLHCCRPTAQSSKPRT